jgi:hypothetical protein
MVFSDQDEQRANSRGIRGRNNRGDGSSLLIVQMFKQVSVAITPRKHDEAVTPVSRQSLQGEAG